MLTQGYSPYRGALRLDQTLQRKYFVNKALVKATETFGHPVFYRRLDYGRLQDIKANPKLAENEEKYRSVAYHQLHYIELSNFAISVAAAKALEEHPISDECYDEIVRFSKKIVKEGVPRPEGQDDVSKVLPFWFKDINWAIERMDANSPYFDKLRALFSTEKAHVLESFILAMGNLSLNMEQLAEVEYLKINADVGDENYYPEHTIAHSFHLVGLLAEKLDEVAAKGLI